MDACPVLPQGAGFISSTTAYVDCQTQALATGAWQALAAPGSTLATVLAGFLTIFIALIGYNLLLGRMMSIREGTLAFVKIGAIFALATSWPAYRTLVYDVVTDGPMELVAEIGPAAGLVGSDGTLVQRLDMSDQALAQLAILGNGSPSPGAANQIVPPPFAGFDAFALGGSRILFLLTAVGGLAAVRVVTGLMLALGPFFIAFLMFDATRSLFEGWVRVLAGAALSAIGVSIVLGLELALLEPWLSGALARRMAGEALPTVSVELFVISLLFAVMVLAALYSCARVARAFRLPFVPRASDAKAAEVRALDRMSGGALHPAATAEPERTRPAAMATMLVAMNRRDFRTSDRRTEVAWTGDRRTARGGRDVDEKAMPLGRTFARRAVARASARATRRDASA